MPQQSVAAVENNFTKGFVTEFTGLNFPENAATQADNCEFTLVGNITRRLGINTEVNGFGQSITRTSKAISSYKWNNAGGEGNTQVVVEQIGGTLYFYLSSASTVTTPLSTRFIFQNVDISAFTATNGTFDPTQECQFADGNGYLFVYHPTCDPFYCTFQGTDVDAAITPVSIGIQIRDFNGIPETIGVSTRPASLTNEHLYNLINQGWTSGSAWSAFSSSTVAGFPGGTATFTIPSGLTITNGDTVNVICNDPNAVLLTNYTAGAVAMSGTVSSYSGTTLTLTITFDYGGTFTTRSYSAWSLVQTNQGHITAWEAAIGNFPSNSDVWWSFKDDTGIFNPATTAANVTISSTNAPQGHFILNAFNQNRGLVSAVPSLTPVTTTVRPRTGTWFQGRVWYTGVDASQPIAGDAPFYTWTESIYFSQIVQTPSDFGSCYQLNDPTSENLFDLLPTDGGLIQIQGSGSIFKLFPIQNGMLVFAANGVWFITGSNGIGFSANDYTITKISSVRSMSCTSFVDVNGLPYFWNEEGIYAVEPQQGGGLAVNPLTIGTILSFYNEIPLQSKVFVRGAYDPINYIIQWTYKSTVETSVTDRYTYDSILNYNTYNKAFFPYSVDTSVSSINNIVYVSYPSGATSPEPAFKYLSSNISTGMVNFADEHDESYLDWGDINFVSSFITGYRLKGQAQRRVQIPYIITYSRGGDVGTSFYIQAIWDYATSGNSGRWSTRQQVNSWDPNFSVIPRRHRLRGQGLVLQLKITSVDGQLFDLMGWSSDELVNTGL